MNRQTLVVTIGTVALVALGAVLMYAAPSEPDGKAKGTRAAAKAKAKGKAKGKDSSKIPASRLIHRRDIPEDRPAAPKGAPNVVVVLTTTMRKDQTTLYDGPEGTTPFLASQAEHGVVFSDALANGVWPKHAQAAVLLGKLPHASGFVEIEPRRDSRRMPQDATLLAERFASAGWTTVGATGSHYLNGRFGMRQGFDWFRESQPFGYPLGSRLPARGVVDATLRGVDQQLEKAKDRPMYVQVALIDSHKPFQVPPEEFKPFEGEHQVAPYRATLLRQDKAIARLTEKLGEKGLTAENTVFFVVADHGEGLEMPMHHRKQHGRSLYGSSVEIPMMAWGKGVAKGKAVDGLASQIDVAPTLLSMAGLPTDGTEGLDLSAVVAKGGTSPRKEHYADTYYEKLRRGSVWTATHQCQKDFGSAETDPDPTFVDGCYDRKADADFTKPIPQPGLQKKLDSQFAGQLEFATKAPALVAGAAPKAKPPVKAKSPVKAKAKAKPKEAPGEKAPTKDKAEKAPAPK